MHTWKELSEDMKRSNLNVSYQLMDKMEATLCNISRLTEWKEPDFAFDPFEIIRLSILEHERWCNKRLRNGCMYNKDRNDNEKQHNLLVPWAELSAEDKRKDFNTVIKLPLVLYKADLKICRIDVIRLIAQAFFQYDLKVSKNEIKDSSRARKEEEKDEKTLWKASEENKTKYLNKARNVKRVLEECGYGITGYVESEEAPLEEIIPGYFDKVVEKYGVFCHSDQEYRKFTDEAKMWSKIFSSSKLAIYNVNKQMKAYENDLRILNEMNGKIVESIFVYIISEELLDVKKLGTCR